MNILLAGQKYFGASVFDEIRKIGGVDIVAVSAPPTDRLGERARQKGVPVIEAGTLNARTMPDGVDLIVAAHSHDFIGEKTRLRSRFGGIGYHPSLLPLHRGRDSIEWAIRMGERVTGGTVYKLSNKMDGGAILAQEHVFIYPGESAPELWRRALCGLGVRLLSSTVGNIIATGLPAGVRQDDSLATFEPSLDVPPAYRPDLLLLNAPAAE